MDLHRITTTDNPFDPITQYDQWLVWDIDSGYHSNALLARVVLTSPDLSSLDQARAIEQGIDEIIQYDPLGVYTKVKLGVFEVSKETETDSDSQAEVAA